MEIAPKDGHDILVCRDNDLNWEYDIVWWGPDHEDDMYPWKVTSIDSDGYPEGRLDYWMPVPDGPYKHE